MHGAPRSNFGLAPAVYAAGVREDCSVLDCIAGNMGH
jgi:hypothetical protein